MRQKKQYEELKQPHIKRPQPFEAPLRIHLNPSRWAVIGGLLSAILALFYFLMRSNEPSLGYYLESMVWIGLTFVVGYAMTGAFMLYILWVREKELEEPAPAPQTVVIEEDELVQETVVVDETPPEEALTEEPAEQATA